MNQGNQTEKFQHQFSTLNEAQLPPLQNAIKEKRMQIILHLIEYGVNLFQIEENELIIRENNKLPLQLFFDKKSSEHSLYAGFEGPKLKWIGTELPHLSGPKVIENIAKLSKESVKGRDLQGLTKLIQCRCIQPLTVAFRQEIIEHDMTLSNRMHISEYIAENGTEEVTMYYVQLNPDYLFKNKEYQRSMIESSITNANHKVLKKLVESLPQIKKQSLPIEGNVPTQDQLISDCLGKSLKRCIESDVLQALYILLNHNLDDCGQVRFNYLYGVEQNTLLHFISLRDRKHTFLEAILEKVSGIDGNLTSIHGKRFIDWKNSDGDSVLHQIVRFEQSDLLICLLSFNPDILLLDDDENTALHIAVEKRNKDLVDTLVSNIEDPKILADFLEAKNKQGLNALHLAINKRSNNIANTLLQAKADFYAKDRENGYTILHHASKLDSQEAREEMVHFVLNYEKDNSLKGGIADVKDLNGNYPMHLAIELHCKDVVSILLENYPDKQLYVRNPEGYTPLHYATLFDAEETIDIINILFNTEEKCERPNKKILNQRCKKGRTPLHLAISKGTQFKIYAHNEAVAIEILNLIFEHGDEVDPERDYLLCRDNDLCSILHHAVMTNNSKILGCVVRQLVKEPLRNHPLNRFGQLLLNLQDKTGRTALIMAIEQENFEIFRELLSYNPSLHCRDYVNQWTVLHHAIDKYSTNTAFFQDVLECLKNKEEFQSLINTLDKKYQTSLHLAIRNDNEQLVEMLIAEGAKIAVEKEFGSDVYTVGLSGDDVLNTKLKFGWKEIETVAHLKAYVIIYKVGSKYLVSTLPNFEETELMNDENYQRDILPCGPDSGDLETMVKNIVATKCPELIQKILKEKTITEEHAPETKLIYVAAQNGSKAVMRYVCEDLEPDFDYESQDTNNGNTLIHYAAKNSIANIKTLKYLLRKTEEFEKGKKEKLARKIINFTNNKDQSALQIIITLRKFEFFIALINRGANLTERNNDGNSILHVLLLEKDKSKSSKFEGMKLVIESILKNETLKNKLSTLLSIKNHNGRTVLQIAIMACQNEIVKFLIINKASVKDIDPRTGNTIVHTAIVNDWDESDMESISVVLNAVRQQDEEKTVLRVRNNDVETPLHISVRKKEKNFMTKSLMDVGVPLGISNRERNTALHIAALNDDDRSIEIMMHHLIKKAKEHQLADRRLEYLRELVRENKNKLMPISIPKKKKNLKAMLRAWNHYHEVSMGDGRSGLLIHFAVYTEKTELVECILESIREIEERHEVGNQSILSCRDTDDLTPLHVAAEIGNEQIVDLLLDYGADIQLNSAKGTPVEIAMQKDHIHLALRFVKKGAKINKYLDLLTYDKIDNRDIQEIFDKKKINVERRISSADCTVIHYAAKQSSVSRIALLLRNNIALTASDRDGKRVLHYAVQYRDDYDVLKFFLDEASKRDEAIERKLERESEENRLEYEELNLSFMEALFYHDLDGINPVMLAASLDRIQLFRLLTTSKYEYLLDSLDACDPDENNVMHYLAKHRSIKTARYIVPRIYKYDVYLFTRIMNDRNVRGESPIDLARKRGLQEMVDLFIEHCDCEYFEACPDVVHRMVRGKDFHNFEKVLDKTVIQDSQNVQLSTKLMDSNEEGAYPNFAYFNFLLDPLWHKLYKSNEIKFKYHPIVKFLIDEKLTIYKWWFLKLFLLYLFSFYIPLVIALSLASSRCDYELFLYNTPGDYARFVFEMYILIFTWVYMMIEVLEIFGKYRYLESLNYTTNDLRYQRRHYVQYYGEESDSNIRKLLKKVKLIFFGILTVFKERLYRLYYSDYFKFFPRFLLRAIYRHFSDTYNMIDLSGILLIFFLYVFRTVLYFSKSDFVVGTHWAIQALTFTVFTLKFFKYTKMIPSLGIYIETLSNVVSRDVPRFALVILIILIGYTGSIQQVARTYTSSQCDKGSCSFSGWFNDDSIPFSPITTPLISGILFTIDGGPSNYEGSLRDVSFLFSIVYLIFAFSIIVILLNVFIAQLSQTYSDINSTKNFLDFKADLALEYESNILFAFRGPNRRTLVQSIIIPIDVWKEYFDSYMERIGNSSKANEDESKFKEVTKSLQDNMDARFNRLEQSLLEITDELRNISPSKCVKQFDVDTDNAVKTQSDP